MPQELHDLYNQGKIHERKSSLQNNSCNKWYRHRDILDYLNILVYRPRKAHSTGNMYRSGTIDERIREQVSNAHHALPYHND